jgi:hypothetical protein
MLQKNVRPNPTRIKRFVLHSSSSVKIHFLSLHRTVKSCPAPLLFRITRWIDSGLQRLNEDRRLIPVKSQVKSVRAIFHFLIFVEPICLGLSVREQGGLHA